MAKDLKARPAPAISVVLPVRNRATRLEAAARCVLDQTWTDLELIIVDGASTDGTRDVMRRLAAADPRVRLVFNDQAEGPSAARNAGVKAAQGRYVAFQDSDDAWLPTKLARQMEALAALPGARMAYAGTRRHLPNGPELRPPDWEGADGDLHVRLLRRSLIITPSLLVERGLFLEVGGFDERLRFAEDWDLVVRLSARTPVACAKEYLVESARIPDSLSWDLGAQLDAVALMADTHEPFLRPHPRLHEQRLVDAGLALLAGGRDGWPLVRRGLAVRPASLHAPLWRGGGRLARSWFRRLRRDVARGDGGGNLLRPAVGRPAAGWQSTPPAPARETPAAARRRRRRVVRRWTSRLTLLLLAVPKLASLLVPRRADLVLVGARGAHLDNLAGILMARPGPPPGVRIRVLVSRRNRGHAALAAAVATLPGARFVGDWSPAALWLSLRAGWVLVSNLKHEDAWRFWLGRARLVYCNHGPWMKRMAPAFGRGRKARLEAWLFGRFEVVLACAEQEVADYQDWFGPGVRVVCLGYPRSPLLEGIPLAKGKVGLWPTWKAFPDPGYGLPLADRLHRGLGVTVEYRPHALSGEAGGTVGPPRTGRPALLVTDFSSVAFDQAYVGGHTLLYSRCLDDYLAQRGIRPSLEPWLRSHMVQDEQDLARRMRAVLAGQDRGVPDPLHLRPFDSASFWSLLAATKR